MNLYFESSSIDEIKHENVIIERDAGEFLTGQIKIFWKTKK